MGQGNVCVTGSCEGLYYIDNDHFHIAIEDNEWSLAIELVQKEGLYGDNLYGLQARHYQKYLEGMKRCLLEHLPSIGIRTGAWTSDVIKREECFA